MEKWEGIGETFNYETRERRERGRGEGAATTNGANGSTEGFSTENAEITKRD